MTFKTASILCLSYAYAHFKELIWRVSFDFLQKQQRHFVHAQSRDGFSQIIEIMGSCMSLICQCHLCRCCECGPGCYCCRCCKRWFGDWWMCSDCCDEFEDEEYSPVNPKTTDKGPPEDGEGMYKYPNGDIYVGEWRRGKRHGYGELVKKDGTQ